VLSSSSYDVFRRARAVEVTPPDGEPVTLDEARAHLRLVPTTEDEQVSRLIKAARQRVEQDTGRALLTQTLDVYYDMPPCGTDDLWVPMPALQSVTSVTYYDPSNASATFSSASYLVDTASDPGRIALNLGYTWPVNLRAVNGLVVRVVAGYGTEPDDVPQPIRQAMLTLVGVMFEHREQVIVSQFAGQFMELPYGYKQLIAPYKLWLM
jgi:uncharacterized phiE125 gp8 family phage protein